VRFTEVRDAFSVEADEKAASGIRGEMAETSLGEADATAG